MVDAAGESSSAQRSLEAHSKGGMCVFVAHPYAPLLATATTTQVLNLHYYAGILLILRRNSIAFVGFCYLKTK